MKKYLVLGLMFLALSVIGAVAVFAEDNTPATTSASAARVAGPMMVNIGPAGNVLLRGTIVSVGTNSLVVKSWGGSWTVEVATTTNIISANKALTDFKADDIVGVMGSISADGDFVIDAKILRAWGHRQDSDKDGIPDNQDTDDDNDGLDNSRDMKHHDHDDDGIIDPLDTDDDGDGILDAEDTKPHDKNNDGIPDFRERREGRGIRMMDNRGPNMENSGSSNSGSDGRGGN